MALRYGVSLLAISSPLLEGRARTTDAHHRHCKHQHESITSIRTLRMLYHKSPARLCVDVDVGNRQPMSSGPVVHAKYVLRPAKFSPSATASTLREGLSIYPPIGQGS